LKITYANPKLERYFSDYKLMQRKIPPEWVRSLKKTMNRLEAADKFGDFLTLGLGKPEQLKGGGEQIRYSVHINVNARLIFELNATCDTILICSEIEVEGVCDYHGSKENWYLP
jgi:proteic killer suppression protein